MELRDIEYFAMVAKHRNLGRAADALCLSPTALSKSLRRLERDLRAKLVNRTPKGVALTIEGEALLDRARGLRLSLADLTREISDLSQGVLGRLRIGAGPSAMPERLLAGAHAALTKASCKITLLIRVDQSDVTLPALRAGELDFVIGGLPEQPDDELVHEPLIDDPMVVIASAAHPLAKRRRISIQEVANAHWASSPADSIIRRRFDRLFEMRGIAPPLPVVEISSASLKLRVAATSNLLTFQSALWLDEPPPGLAKLLRIPVSGMTLNRRTGVLYRKSGYLSPAARRFLDALRMTAKEACSAQRVF